jgi:large subunit ribosomal protein L14e
MAAIEKGSICIKTRGRNAGKKVTVTAIEKDGFVIIEAEKMKKKRCNPKHLFPTGEKK